MKLENKVTVVTGGNSGIGFGIAEALKIEGAVGVITGRNQAMLDIPMFEVVQNCLSNEQQLYQ